MLGTEETLNILYLRKEARKGGNRRRKGKGGEGRGGERSTLHHMQHVTDTHSWLPLCYRFFYFAPRQLSHFL